MNISAFKPKNMGKGLWLGFCASAASLLLALIDPALALVPMAIYLLLCLIAPFMYRFGFFLPVIYRGRSGRRIVALSFDDGPDPITTPLLLERLAARRVTATFFVIGRRAAAYPGLIQAILAAGHTIGNHSFSHDSLVAFKGFRRIFTEIAETQRLLSEMGVTPLLFRPPVGITYPGLRKAMPRLGLNAVTFSCLARDGGNRSIGRLSARILRRVRADDIIMLHDSRPHRRAHLHHWLAEIDRILAGIPQKGLAIRPMAELIGRPVDRRSGFSPGSCASRAGRPPDSRP